MTNQNALTLCEMQLRDGVQGVFVTNETTGEVKWMPDPGFYAPVGWRAATHEEVKTLEAEIMSWSKEVN